MFRWLSWIETCWCYDTLSKKKNIILTIVHLLVLLCELFIKAGTWQILRGSGTQHKRAVSQSAPQLHVILPTRTIEKTKWCREFIVSRSIDRQCHNISGYCSWQMRTSLTLTSFAGSLFNRVPVKNISPCDCICTFFWSSFVRCSVYKKVKVYCICNTKQTEHKKSIIMHNAQNSIELQPSILLTGLNRLLVTKM
jgi:hypothetical protein